MIVTNGKQKTRKRSFSSFLKLRKKSSKSQQFPPRQDGIVHNENEFTLRHCTPCGRLFQHNLEIVNCRCGRNLSPIQSNENITYADQGYEHMSSSSFGSVNPNYVSYGPNIFRYDSFQRPITSQPLIYTDDYGNTIYRSSHPDYYSSPQFPDSINDTYRASSMYEPLPRNRSIQPNARGISNYSEKIPSTRTTPSLPELYGRSRVYSTDEGLLAEPNGIVMNASSGLQPTHVTFRGSLNEERFVLEPRNSLENESNWQLSNTSMKDQLSSGYSFLQPRKNFASGSIVQPNYATSQKRLSHTEMPENERTSYTDTTRRNSSNDLNDHPTNNAGHFATIYEETVEPEDTSDTFNKRLSRPPLIDSNYSKVEVEEKLNLESEIEPTRIKRTSMVTKSELFTNSKPAVQFGESQHLNDNITDSLNESNGSLLSNKRVSRPESIESTNDRRSSLDSLKESNGSLLRNKRVSIQEALEPTNDRRSSLNSLNESNGSLLRNKRVSIQEALEPTNDRRSSLNSLKESNGLLLRNKRVSEQEALEPRNDRRSSLDSLKESNESLLRNKSVPIREALEPTNNRHSSLDARHDSYALPSIHHSYGESMDPMYESRRSLDPQYASSRVNNYDYGQLPFHSRSSELSRPYVGAKNRLYMPRLSQDTQTRQFSKSSSHVYLVPEDQERNERRIPTSSMGSMYDARYQLGEPPFRKSRIMHDGKIRRSIVCPCLVNAQHPIIREVLNCSCPQRKVSSLPSEGENKRDYENVTGKINCPCSEEQVRLNNSEKTCPLCNFCFNPRSSSDDNTITLANFKNINIERKSNDIQIEVLTAEENYEETAAGIRDSPKCCVMKIQKSSNDKSTMCCDSDITCCRNLDSCTQECKEHNLWGLQFLRWWGWNWLRKKQEQMHRSCPCPGFAEWPKETYDSGEKIVHRHSSESPNKKEAEKVNPSETDRFDRWTKKIIQEYISTPSVSVIDTTNSLIPKRIQPTIRNINDKKKSSPVQDNSGWTRCRKKDSNVSIEEFQHVSSSKKRDMNILDRLRYLTQRIERIQSDEESDDEDDDSCSCICNCCKCYRNFNNSTGVQVEKDVKNQGMNSSTPNLHFKNIATNTYKNNMKKSKRKRCQCCKCYLSKPCPCCQCNSHLTKSVEPNKTSIHSSYQSKPCPCCQCNPHLAKSVEPNKTSIHSNDELEAHDSYKTAKKKNNADAQASRNSLSKSSTLSTCLKFRKSMDQTVYANYQNILENIRKIPYKTFPMFDEPFEFHRAEGLTKDIEKVLNTGKFSSPVSGHIYNLKPETVNIPRMQKSTDEPIEFLKGDNKLKYLTTNGGTYKTDHHNTQYLTAIGEAILSTSKEITTVEETDFNTFLANSKKSQDTAICSVQTGFLDSRKTVESNNLLETNGNIEETIIPNITDNIKTSHTEQDNNPKNHQLRMSNKYEPDPMLKTKRCGFNRSTDVKEKRTRPIIHKTRKAAVTSDKQVTVPNKFSYTSKPLSTKTGQFCSSIRSPKDKPNQNVLLDIKKKKAIKKNMIGFTSNVTLKNANVIAQNRPVKEMKESNAAKKTEQIQDDPEASVSIINKLDSRPNIFNINEERFQEQSHVTSSVANDHICAKTNIATDIGECQSEQQKLDTSEPTIKIQPFVKFDDEVYSFCNRFVKCPVPSAEYDPLKLSFTHKIKPIECNSRNSSYDFSVTPFVDALIGRRTVNIKPSENLTRLASFGSLLEQRIASYTSPILNIAKSGKRDVVIYERPHRDSNHPYSVQVPEKVMSKSELIFLN